MLAFSAFIAGSFTLGALASPHIAPVALNSVRFWIATVILGVAALGMGQMRREWFRAPWRHGVLGFLYVVYFILMFEALRIAPPVSLSAVFTLTPLVAGFFGWWFLRQRMTSRMLTALMIGAAGALWVIFDADWRAALSFRIGRGEAIYVVAVIAHAIYTPGVRALNRGEPALVFTFGVMLAAAAIATVSGIGPIFATDWANLPSIVWITIAYTAVFATAASVFLMQVASLRLPAAKVMAHTYLVPGWVVVWELSFGHRPPSALILAGLVLSMVALILLLRDEEAPLPAR